MKAITVLLLLLVLLLTGIAPAAASDDVDRLHAGYGALTAATVDTVLYHTAPQLSRCGRVVVSAVGATAFLAGTNELGDMASSVDRYGRDQLLATAGGAALGALVAELTNGLFFVSASGDQALLGVAGRW